MKREELNRKIGEELAHIPRGLRGSDQNEFRMIYNTVRRRDLGQSPLTPRTVSFATALGIMRRDKPKFVPVYDLGFFGSVEIDALLLRLRP